MTGVDLFSQEFAVALVPGETDYDTFRACTESHFDLGGSQRLIPPTAEHMTIYQGSDGRELRLEGNRLVLNGAQWEREAAKWADALTDLCTITGVAIAASGVNPHFVVEVHGPQIPSSLMTPGPLLTHLLGEDVQPVTMRVSAMRGRGRLTCNLSFTGGAQTTLQVVANWHEPHANVKECADRLRVYRDQVGQLHAEVQQAIKEVTHEC